MNARELFSQITGSCEDSEVVIITPDKKQLVITKTDYDEVKNVFEIHTKVKK